MGFLSALGKIGAGIAAPFTGGASLAAIPIIDSIGKAAGGAAKGSADQRIAETPGQVAAYRANLDATQVGDRRAALASLLGGLQDVQIGRPANSTIPTFALSGGLRPSAMTNRDALLQRLQAPIDPLELPKAGMGEKILGGVGLAGSLLGAVGNAIKPSDKARVPRTDVEGATLANGGFVGAPMSGFVDPGPGQRNPWAMY